MEILTSYVQKINASGVAQWTADGVAISVVSIFTKNSQRWFWGSNYYLEGWSQWRIYDVYAQKINAYGVVQWTADGVAISTAVNSQDYPTIISDGSGGAIIAWRDFRSETDFDIYAQKINSSGVVEWTADGVVISAALDYQEYPIIIISNGMGGAVRGKMFAPVIMTSTLRRSTQTEPCSRYGVAISTSTYNEFLPTIVSDGMGGAIITWEIAVMNYDIYAAKRSIQSELCSGQQVVWPYQFLMAELSSSS